MKEISSQSHYVATEPEVTSLSQAPLDYSDYIIVNCLWARARARARARYSTITIVHNN